MLPPPPESSLLTTALGGNALSPPGGDQSYAVERASIVHTDALAGVLDSPPPGTVVTP